MAHSAFNEEGAAYRLSAIWNSGPVSACAGACRLSRWVNQVVKLYIVMRLIRKAQLA
jgi:hypothetical protein